MFDNYSASEQLAAFLLGDITSALLGSTGLQGLADIEIAAAICKTVATL